MSAPIPTQVEASEQKVNRRKSKKPVKLLDPTPATATNSSASESKPISKEHDQQGLINSDFYLYKPPGSSVQISRYTDPKPNTSDESKSSVSASATVVKKEQGKQISTSHSCLIEKSSCWNPPQTSSNSAGSKPTSNNGSKPFVSTPTANMEQGNPFSQSDPRPINKTQKLVTTPVTGTTRYEPKPSSSTSRMAKEQEKPVKKQMTSSTSPEVMVFRPTWEEFQDFPKYVEYMESCGAHLVGIAKIIPPPEYKPRSKNINSNYDNIEMDIPHPICQVKSGNNGAYQNLNVVKKAMRLKTFRQIAELPENRTPNHNSYDDLERKFWRSLPYGTPIYGADVSGSLIDLTYAIWNINHLESILDLLKEKGLIIAGVNTAYLYFGMWKTTFCWHTEDMDLYSINYLHFGAPKSWYVIPPQHGRRFERLTASHFPDMAAKCKSFLRHKTTIMSPTLLQQKNNLPVGKTVQQQGEIIITFPYAYHSGFNHGFNIAESTNFALERWIEYGKWASLCKCEKQTVRIDMEPFVQKYQPLAYDFWMAGVEVGRHPEDPAVHKSKTPVPNLSSSDNEDEQQPSVKRRKLQPLSKRKQAQRKGARSEQKLKTSSDQTVIDKLQLAEKVEDHVSGPSSGEQSSLEKMSSNSKRRKKQDVEYDLEDIVTEAEYILYEDAYIKAGEVSSDNDGTQEDEASDFEDQVDETGHWKEWQVPL